MRISNKIFNFLIVVLLFPTHSLSQDDVEEWDVTLARGKRRDISFETNEGPWMSVDISPNLTTKGDITLYLLRNIISYRTLIG